MWSIPPPSVESHGATVPPDMWRRGDQAWDQLHRGGHLLRFAALGIAAGAVAGTAAFTLLRSLQWATETRIDHPWLIWLLPPMGLSVGLANHYLAGRAAEGSTLLLDEIHEPGLGVPRRMAPFIYLLSVASHVVGASVGREGAAVQMAASLNGWWARLLPPASRRTVLIASLAGGFAGAFGTPLAGTVFALEVQTSGAVRYDALVPALAAGVTGDRVARALGLGHGLVEPISVSVDLVTLLKVALAGVAFGLVGTAFVQLTRLVRALAARLVRWPPLRPALGGVAILVLLGLVGTRQYLGLSLGLADRSLAGGAGVIGLAFALKLLFTSVSLGFGFQGGEVTPLFVMGASLGVTLARLLDVPVPLLAACGFVAVFAGAANTPLTCTFLGAELFGSAGVVYFAVACVLAYIASADSGLYEGQRRELAKLPRRLRGPGPP